MVAAAGPRVISAILLLAALMACGGDESEPRATPSVARDAGEGASSDESDAQPFVWRSFIARHVNAAGAPQDTRIFDEPGPVGYYMMAAGATNDTIEVQLVAGSATIDRCDSYVLDGYDGYFCEFEFLEAGDYTVDVILNGERLERLSFAVSNASGLPHDGGGQAADSRERLSSIPWQRRPSERDYARVYPDRARERGVSGRVLLSCTILHDGDVDCAVVEEDPRDVGFGGAALELSRRFRMRTRLEDGRSSVGSVVDVPVRFEPS